RLLLNAAGSTACLAPGLEEAGSGRVANGLAGLRSEISGVGTFAFPLDGIFLPAVGREDQARKTYPVTIADGMAGDGRAAGTVARCQECTLAGDRVIGGTVVYGRQEGGDPLVVDTAFDADCALCRPGWEIGRVHQVGHHVRHQQAP